MFKRLLASILFIILPLALLSPVIAQTLETNESTLVKKDQVINQDYFAAGEKVTVAGVINGDAYLAGGNVSIEGEIKGDLIVAGGTVNVSGKVDQDLRVAGGQVVISGEIGRNVTALGGSVNITDSATINGSLTAATGSLQVFAPVTKGATIGAGDVTIADSIGGDIQAGVGNLTLSPNAQVGGNLTYVSDKEADIQPGAQVSGETKHNLPPKPDQGKNEKALTAAATTFKLLSFLAALLIGLLLVKFFPIFTGKVSQKVEEKLVFSLGLGLLTVIVVPIITVILLITVVAIPIALILIFAFLVSLYMAKIFVALFIGRKTFKMVKQKTGDYQALFVGLLIYYLLTIIPIIGGLITLLTIIVGIGALAFTKKELYSQFNSKKLL